MMKKLLNSEDGLKTNGSTVEKVEKYKQSLPECT
jgi:hypothetical protein